MTTQEIAALQIGDEVGYYKCGNWGDLLSPGFGVVEKITPKRGDITIRRSEPAEGMAVGNVESLTFDKTGDLRGQSRWTGPTH